MRIIGFEISHNGKPYLKGSTADNGKRRSHHLWRDLKQVALYPVEGARVEADGAVATLKGPTRIKVLYGPTTEVDELRLVRCKQDATAWSVVPEDVERIARDLGLPEVTADDQKLAEERSGDDVRLEPPALPIPTPSAPAPPQLQFPLWRAIGVGTTLLVGLGAATHFTLTRLTANETISIS